MLLKDISRKQLTLSVMVFAAFAVLYSNTFYSLHRKWIILEQTYSHGYLVLILTGILLYKRKDSLLELPVKPNLFFLACFVAASLVWLVGRLADVQILHQLTIPLMLSALVFATFGVKIGLRCVSPLLLLYLAIPIWDMLLSVPLRLAAVAISRSVLEFLSIPVFVQEFSIHLPAGTLIVAGGCAGIGFFLTAMTIGAFNTILRIHGVYRQIAIMLVCAALGIVINWVRVVALVLIGHYTQVQHWLVTDGHLTFGWIVFVVMIIPFFSLLNKYDSGDQPLPGASTAQSPPITKAETPVLLLIIALCCVGLAPAATYYLKSGHPQMFTFKLPTSIDQYTISEFSPEWEPRFVNADEVHNFKLERADGQSFVAHLSYYQEEKQEKEVVNTENRLFDESWRFERDSVYVESKSSPQGFTVNQAIVKQPIGSIVVRYWYIIGGRVVLGEAAAKLAHVRALLENRRDAAFVMLRTDCSADCDFSAIDDATATLFFNLEDWIYQLK